MDTPEKKTIEERYKFIEQQRQFGTWFRKNLSWIILIIASILFIFKEGLEFSASNDDLLTLIMSMSFTYLFALYVSISLRQMGKKAGKESNLYTNALKYLSESKSAIKKIVFLLPRFVKYKNETALKDVQKLFIEENGMIWSLYEKGYYKKQSVIENLEEKQIKALKHISKIKITKITVSNLLSEHSKSKLRYTDPLYLGKDESTDQRQSMVSMMITKAVLPIITSYFAIQVVLGTSLLWGAIQVAVIMLMGVTHYMEGEDFIITELRNRQINKADLLIEFHNLHENKSPIFKDELELVESISAEAEDHVEKEQIPAAQLQPSVN